MVHSARQLARHPHKGRALLLKELEPPDDLVVGLGGAYCRSDQRLHRWDLELRRFLRRDIVDDFRCFTNHWTFLFLFDLSILLLVVGLLGAESARHWQLSGGLLPRLVPEAGLGQLQRCEVLVADDLDHLQDFT